MISGSKTGDPELLRKRIDELERELLELKSEAFLGAAGDTYKSVLEYSPVPLWINRDNRIVFANSAAAGLFGATRAGDLTGCCPLDFIHPDFHQLVESRRKQAILLNRPAPAIEQRIRRLDGTVVDVEGTTRAFPFEGGTAVIATFVDLTERKRWEEVLRISGERLELVISSIELGLWYCDLPFSNLVWNDRCKAHFGLPLDAEVTIDTFYERLHPDDRAPTREAIDGAIAGRGVYDMQYRTEGLDGVERWIRAIGRAFYDSAGAPRRFDGVSVDISDQKRIESALRRNEESYRELLHREGAARTTAELLNRVGPLLAAELDVSRLVQAATDIATALTGAEYGVFFYNAVDDRGEDTLYTSSGAARESFAAVDAPRAAELFASMFRDSRFRDSRFRDNMFRDKNIVRLDDVRADPAFAGNPPYAGLTAGLPPVVSYLAVPVVSRSGEALGGLFFAHSRPGVFQAEHERMAAGISAQAAIAIDNARLFEQVNRERDKAQAAQQALEASNAELQQFAYVASHDLQEPLRTISSFTQLLEKRLTPCLDHETAEFMGYVVSGARRMSDIIQDLLVYTRLQDGAAAPFAAVDMNRVLAQAVEGLRAMVDDTAAEISWDALPLVCGDELQLMALAQNLIANAIKYRDAAPPHVGISASHEGGHFVFAVRDNGIGIDPMYHERIFGIFKRLHGKEVPGTGIGLAICKRIVERHGGGIWVESKLGEGSTFYFTLPPA